MHNTYFLTTTATEGENKQGK